MHRRTKHEQEAPPRAHPNAGLVAEGARRCPICSSLMQTVRREGDSIDVCEDHGVWLDRDELTRMFENRSRWTKARVARARAKGRAKGRLAGFFFGMLMT